MLLLLFDKGEGLRNIGLYGALSAWFILAISVKKPKISFNVLTISFFFFISSILLSSVFSIGPLYSFYALKDDVLKAVIIFLIISTSFNLEMLLRLCRVMCISGIIILAFGLHGFLSSETGIYGAENIFLTAGKNKFGFFVGFLFPFFMLFFIRSKIGLSRLLLGLSLIWAVFGIIFSSSRGAIGNMLGVLAVWSIPLMQKRRLKSAVIVAAVFILSIGLSFKIWPNSVKDSILTFPQHLSTFNMRTSFFWEPAVDAIKKRPVLGWGYGKNIWRDVRPFEDGKLPNWEIHGGFHSTFITVIFHQGIAGFLSYLFLLGSNIFILIKILKNSTDDKRLIALTLLSVIVGSFVVNSIVLNVSLRRLAPIAGMSAALYQNRSRI